MRIDYGKLKHLILIDKEKSITTNGNFDRLKEIIRNGELSSDIEEGFPMEKIADKKNFISLLYYFGLLTIKSGYPDDTVLTIPNETIRRLYYDYIKDAYEETGTFSLDLYTYERLIKAMAAKGEWRPRYWIISQTGCASV